MGRSTHMDDRQVSELLYQSLEVEIGGQRVYETAITCALNEDLKEEWEKYLERDEDPRGDPPFHVRPYRARSRGRDAGSGGGADKAESLVRSMEMALARADRAAAAQLVGGRVRGRGRDEGPPGLGAHRSGRREGNRVRWSKALQEAYERSRSRRTSTSTTRWARAPESSGSSRLAWRRYSRRPKRRRRS